MQTSRRFPYSFPRRVGVQTRAWHGSLNRACQVCTLSTACDNGTTPLGPQPRDDGGTAESRWMDAPPSHSATAPTVTQMPRQWTGVWRSCEGTVWDEPVSKIHLNKLNLILSRVSDPRKHSDSPLILLSNAPGDVVGSCDG